MSATLSSFLSPLFPSHQHPYFKPSSPSLSYRLGPFPPSPPLWFPSSLTPTTLSLLPFSYTISLIIFRSLFLFPPFFHSTLHVFFLPFSSLLSFTLLLAPLCLSPIRFFFKSPSISSAPHRMFSLFSPLISALPSSCSLISPSFLTYQRSHLPPPLPSLIAHSLPFLSTLRTCRS